MLVHFQYKFVIATFSFFVHLDYRPLHVILHSQASNGFANHNREKIEGSHAHILATPSRVPIGLFCCSLLTIQHSYCLSSPIFLLLNPKKILLQATVIGYQGSYYQIFCFLHRSQITIRHSPLTAHRSPLTAHRSQDSTPQLPIVNPSLFDTKFCTRVVKQMVNHHKLFYSNHDLKVSLPHMWLYSEIKNQNT